jgi:hypothetical protein
LVDLVTYVRKNVWYVCLCVYATLPITTQVVQRETLDTHETLMFSNAEMATIFTAFVSKTHETLLTSLHNGNTYMYMYWEATCRYM